MNVPIRIEGTSVWKNYLVNCKLHPKEEIWDCRAFLEGCSPWLEELINRSSDYYDMPIKFWSALKVRLTKSGGAEISSYFTHIVQIFNMDENPDFSHIFNQIIENLQKFQEKGSGWNVEFVEHLQVHLSPWKPIRGGTYAPLPDFIQKKKAILNIKNKDQKCFLWSIIAARKTVLWGKHAERVSKYKPFETELDSSGLHFPITLDQITTFEEKNNISINVYSCEDYKKQVVPLRVSKAVREEHVHVFYYKGHFSLVRSLDRLLSSSYNHNKSKYFCDRCLTPQWTEAKLKDHLTRCSTDDAQKYEMPKDNNLKFTNHRRKLRAPMVIYADFEAILEKEQSCQPSADSSFTTCQQRHVPSSFGIYQVNCCCKASTGNQPHPEIYRGRDCTEQFLESVIARAKEHQELLDQPKPLNLSNEEIVEHRESTHCYLCEKEFNATDTKDRDHCHICGKYRGAAHGACNRALQLTRDVTVVFHNLRHYDSHFIMKEISRACLKHKFQLSVIAKTVEDYIGFKLTRRGTKRKQQQRKQNAKRSCVQDFIDSTELSDEEDELESVSWSIRFIDSAQFLLSSLDNLVKGTKKFRNMRAHFPPNKADMMLRKGVFPYEYVDSWKKYDDNVLPPRSQFYSSLNEQECLEDDYAYAQNVFKSFNLTCLGEYSDLYLKCDVILLADVFENFRDAAIRNYKLDPIHYYTLPGYSWDACLKYTAVEIELVHDENMYMFFKSGIRGGISMISHRMETANNEEAGTQCYPYDSTKLTKFLLYLDANNLYGNAMSEKLPLKDFRWLTDEDIFSFDPATIDSLGEKGWILEVDLEYPVELHDLHNAYPLAPEKMLITEEMLSPYAQDRALELNVKCGKVEKLVPNLMNKSNYIVHIRNLQFYLSHGLKLKKIHRAIEFSQESFLKSYIALNTHLRQQAQSDAESDMCKLMNNAIFGKTMEDVTKRVNVTLCTTQKQYEKLDRDPLYVRRVHFSDEKGNELIAVLRQKKVVTLDKPIAVGFTVLELSKEHMYNFHYNHMMPKYGPERAQLLFTDTDSLCYCIQTEDINCDMAEDINLYDTSNYPKDHRLYSTRNKKVLGKMKNETAGIPIQEFIGLRAKLYSLLTSNEEMKRAKGTKKYVVKKKIRHSDYKNVLQKGCLLRHQMKMFRSQNHDLKTIKVNKISLSAFDDKRYLHANGISSYAYGHYNISRNL